MIFQVLSKFRPDRQINGPDSVKWICLNPNRGILIQILANQSLVHIQYRAHFSLNSPASICSSQYIVFFCLPIYVFIKLLFESFRQSFSRICLSKFIYLCLSLYTYRTTTYVKITIFYVTLVGFTKLKISIFCFQPSPTKPFSCGNYCLFCWELVFFLSLPLYNCF